MLLSWIVLFPLNLVMALQENSSEINTSTASMKKFLPTIFSLVLNVSCVVVQFSVVSTLMDYLLDSVEQNGQDQRIAIIFENLHDGISSICVVIVYQISEAYTGCFTMITICIAATIQGLILLFTSASTLFGAVYPAIFFLILAKSATNLSETFLDHQLHEKIKETKKQDNVSTICSKIWLCAPWFVGNSIKVLFAFTIYTYQHTFLLMAIVMGGAYLLFLFGWLWYRHEELPAESNTRKIYRICKAAFAKQKSKYPTNRDCYYWRDYKQDHLYRHGEELRLLPQVPLLRWLDKAAIVKAEEEFEDPEVSPKTKEKNGKLCSVREVREVKSLVPMICLCFAFIPYSLLEASVTTLFVAQANSMESFIRNDITVLFLIVDGAESMSQFICFLISVTFQRCLRKFRVIKINRKAGAIIRIGFGLVCAVICSFVAMKVEMHRLLINKDVGLKYTTVALIPQFSLMGMAKGLIEDGLKNLFKSHAAKSMWSFKDSYSELVIGAGKLFTIPIVLIFRSWFNKSVNSSHLDRFYLMLGIFNAVFLFVFAYISIRYAYNEECPEDETILIVEQTLENVHQPDSEDSPNAENSNETQPVKQGTLTRTMNQFVVFVYVNGRICEDLEGVRFEGTTKAIQIKCNVSFNVLKRKIHAKLKLQPNQVISSLTCRLLLSRSEGKYTTIQICDNEDVKCMINAFEKQNDMSMMELYAEVDDIYGSIPQLSQEINSGTSSDQELSSNQSMVSLISSRVANSGHDDDDHNVLQSFEGKESYEGDILDGGLSDADMEEPSSQVSNMAPTDHLVFPSEEVYYEEQSEENSANVADSG